MLTRKKYIGTVSYMGGVMSVPEPFSYAWGNMCAFTQEALCQENEYVEYTRTKLSLHDFARNDLYAKMRGDWIVMLDTDITFQPDIVARLVALAYRNNLGVLAGLYSYKTPPHYPLIYKWSESAGRHETIARWDKSAEILQVDSAGGGCMFIRRVVLDAVRDHYGCQPFDRIGTIGEDHSFAIRLRKLGIKMHAAMRVQVEHLAYLGLSPDTAYSQEVGCQNYLRESEVEGIRQVA